MMHIRLCVSFIAFRYKRLFYEEENKKAQAPTVGPGPPELCGVGGSEGPHIAHPHTNVGFSLGFQRSKLTRFATSLL